MNAFMQGAIAGYGIAIPVGAVAVLIIEIGLRRGFRHGFAAGAGAAAADLFYALLAAAAGAILSPLLAPFAFWLRLGGAVVLAYMGISGMRAVFCNRKTDQEGANAGEKRMGEAPLKTFARFLTITLLNPMTVLYFAALILGGSTSLSTSGARLMFVGGAALASLSWQSLLAVLGAFGHRYLSPRFRFWTSLAGNMIVIGFAIRLLITAFQ